MIVDPKLAGVDYTSPAARLITRHLYNKEVAGKNDWEPWQKCA